MIEQSHALEMTCRRNDYCKECLERIIKMHDLLHWTKLLQNQTGYLFVKLIKSIRLVKCRKECFVH